MFLHYQFFFSNLTFLISITLPDQTFSTFLLFDLLSHVPFTDLENVDLPKHVKNVTRTLIRPMGRRKVCEDKLIKQRCCGVRPIKTNQCQRRNEAFVTREKKKSHFNGSVRFIYPTQSVNDSNTLVWFSV